LSARRSVGEHRYALRGFDDRNRPEAREDLTIRDVKALREKNGVKAYQINPMQGDPPPKPPPNRSTVRHANGKYPQVTLGKWLAETCHYHVSVFGTHSLSPSVGI
jgi:hypothetical protein